MKRRFILLRITFWLGIIADAIETIRMTFPKLFISTTRIKLTPDISLQFGLLYVMPVMLGWTILLLWADRKPLERRGILLCLLPVVIAAVGVEIFAISKGFVSVQQMIPAFVSQSILIGLSIVSYSITRKVEAA